MTKVNIYGRDKGSESECSFCWSIRVVLSKSGIDIPSYEISGYSLNAFAIWVNSQLPLSLWSEGCCHLFAKSLFKAVGVRSELLSVPNKHSPLDYLINHWSGRIEESLARGVPVAAQGLWPNSSYLWGLITDWDAGKRVLQGLSPNSKGFRENEAWPKKILIAAGTALTPNLRETMESTLLIASKLGANTYSASAWISGMDAYLLWLKYIKNNFSKEEKCHRILAKALSKARLGAACFISHHTVLSSPETEKMMLALAKRYQRIAQLLKDAYEAPGKQPFVNDIIAAMRQEEKALALLDEILFHIQ